MFVVGCYGGIGFSFRYFFVILCYQFFLNGGEGGGGGKVLRVLGGWEGYIEFMKGRWFVRFEESGEDFEFRVLVLEIVVGFGCSRELYGFCFLGDCIFLDIFVGGQGGGFVILYLFFRVCMWSI